MSLGVPSSSSKKQTINKMKTPDIVEYKGHDLIVLNPDEKFPFQFGQKKAKLIVEWIDAIAHFAETGEMLKAAKSGAKASK